MATMNLYLPDALKAEMEHVEGVNWSQVAQTAFKWTVELERIRQVSVTEAGLARLRKGRETKEERETAEAEASGKEWALNHAEYDELEAVAGIETEDDNYWVGEPDAYGWARCLLDAMRGDGEWTRDELEAFCEEHLDKAYPGAHEVRAFIDGAKEVFAEV